jgi:hypothetical protein
VEGTRSMIYSVMLYEFEAGTEEDHSNSMGVLFQRSKRCIEKKLQKVAISDRDTRIVVSYMEKIQTSEYAVRVEDLA